VKGLAGHERVIERPTNYIVSRKTKRTGEVEEDQRFYDQAKTFNQGLEARDGPNPSSAREAKGGKEPGPSIERD